MPTGVRKRRVALGADSPKAEVAEAVADTAQPKAPQKVEPLEPGTALKAETPATEPKAAKEAKPPREPKAKEPRAGGPGRLLVRTLAWLCVLVLAGTAVAAWAEARPDLTKEDARTFARRALEEAGFDDVEVAPVVPEGKDQPVEGPEGDVLDVWVTAVTVETGTVSLWVHKKEAQATRAYGNGTDGTPLLTAEQYEVLDDYTRDPALERRYRRNYAVTAAAVLGAVVAVVIGARLRRPG